MKILYVNHPESDYGGYQLYTGLKALLGSENVIEFPYKPSYHGVQHRYTSWWYKDSPQGVTSPYPWSIAHEGVNLSEPAVRDMLQRNEINLVVAESPRAVTLETLRSLRSRLPTMLMDSEDYDQVRTDLIHEFGFGVYLKRELKCLDVHHGCLVRPFTFATCAAAPPVSVEQDIDVFCAVGETNPARVQIKNIINRLGTEGYKVDTTRYGWEEYMARTARAKIAVAPRGWGQDTLRRWDIPAQGALLLAETLTIIDRVPLLHDVHAVYYNTDASDFESKVRYWLRCDEQRKAVARAGQDLIFLYHTAEARAREVLTWAHERWPELR